MACHTPPLKKVKKQGEMPLPSLGPIPLKNVEFRDGMGPRLGNGISRARISPCFLRGGVWQAILNPLCFSEIIFCFSYVRFLELMKCVASLR